MSYAAAKLLGLLGRALAHEIAAATAREIEAIEGLRHRCGFSISSRAWRNVIATLHGRWPPRFYHFPVGVARYRL